MFWKNFSDRHPEEKGWYMTTVEVKGQQRYTMTLYWYPEIGKWIDNTRQDVFDTYYVNNYCGQRLHTTSLCDRTDDVVAWRKIPRPYMNGFRKEDGNLESYK